MFLKFIHAAAGVCLCGQTSVEWTQHVMFTQYTADRRLGCFYFLASVIKAAMSIYVPVFEQMYVFISLGCIPRCGIARADRNSVLKLLGSFQTFPKWLRYLMERSGSDGGV